MSELVAAGGLAFVWGLSPGAIDDPGVPLAESVEDQTRALLANLDTLLERQGLGRGDVVALRLYVTQFPRLEKRARRAFDGAFDPAGAVTVSWVGVSALPREALIALDCVARKT